MGSPLAKEVSTRAGSECSSKYGWIYLQTDKTVYREGNLVTGKIYMDVSTLFPGNKLFLQFEGKEVINLVPRKLDELRPWFKKTRFITKQDCCIYSWEESVEPGQYEIPFSFKLPSSLEASFHQEGESYSAYLTYKLTAVLQTYSRYDTGLTHESHLIIREDPKEHLTNFSDDTTTVLTNCWCFPKGYNELKATFEKNSYSPGEIAQVTVNFDNSQSHSNNEEIVFALVQRFKISPGTTSKNFIKARKSVPGVLAGSSISTSLAIEIPPFKGDALDLDDKLDQIPKGTTNENYGNVSLVTNGRLFSSELFLEVYCPMKGCDQSPRISFPVEINYPDPELKQVPLSDPWNPEVIPKVDAVLSPSDYTQELKYKAGHVDIEMVEQRMPKSDGLSERLLM